MEIVMGKEMRRHPLFPRASGGGRGGRIRLAVIVAMGGVMLAGCGTASGPPGSSVNLGGFSPAFKQGYAAGCESAGAGGRQRHEARYKGETDYRMGWDDGYSVCRRQ